MPHFVYMIMFVMIFVILIAGLIGDSTNLYNAKEHCEKSGLVPTFYNDTYKCVSIDSLVEIE